MRGKLQDQQEIFGVSTERDLHSGTRSEPRHRLTHIGQAVSVPGQSKVESRTSQGVS